MKKKNVGVVASLMALKSKVFGAPSIAVGLYESTIPSVLEICLKIFQAIILPVLFLIGVIIYLKKSKDSKKKKFITTLMYLLLIVGTYYVIEFLLYIPREVVVE